MPAMRHGERRVFIDAEICPQLRDGLLVCGLEVYEPEKFEHVMNSVSVLAEDAGVQVIPVYTEIRHLGPYDNRDFWGHLWLDEFMGAS